MVNSSEIWAMRGWGVGGGSCYFQPLPGGGSADFIPMNGGGSRVFGPSLFLMLRPTPPPPPPTVLFDQSLIKQG